MKRLLKILIVVIILLVAAMGGLFWYLFGGLQAQSAGLTLGTGAEAVYDGFSTVFLLDAGGGSFVLIDAGNDTTGKPILAALQKHNATADNVTAIFMTHAHPDHDAAIAVFPKATVYAMKREIPVAQGKEDFHSTFSMMTGKTNPHPFEIGHPLDDGEKITVGNLEVTAFDVPGHTAGSGAYLAQGNLYLGDAAQISSAHKVVAPSKAFSTDVALGVVSLKHLAEELQPRAAEVKLLVTSHSGGLAAGPSALAAVSQ
jgi:glyoxylase-like metal-dependent hydrolase (beta-lactamase superfamily II)